MAEPELALSIGSVLGGTAAPVRAWRDAITELSKRVIDARQLVTSPLNLNVVFHVPGEIVEPEAEYVRTGRYDPNTRTLLVQVTVPKLPPPEPAALLRSRLDDAIVEAEAWAERRGLPHELIALRRVAQSL